MVRSPGCWCLGVRRTMDDEILMTIIFLLMQIIQSSTPTMVKAITNEIILANGIILFPILPRWQQNPLSSQSRRHQPLLWRFLPRKYFFWISSSIECIRSCFIFAFEIVLLFQTVIATIVRSDRLRS